MPRQDCTPPSVAPERWLPVVGYEGLYEVSDAGRVRGLDRVVRATDGRSFPIRGRVLQGGGDPDSYRLVSLSRGGTHRTWKVHHLVLEAFVGPRPAGRVCAHNDGDPENNRAGNLRWATPAENAADKVKHNTHNRGIRHNMAKLSRADVVDIRKRCSNGETGRSVAQRYEVSEATVSLIRRGIHWSHVPDPEGYINTKRHPRTGTDRAYAQAIALIAGGHSQRSAAKIAGLSEATVSRRMRGVVRGGGGG